VFEKRMMKSVHRWWKKEETGGRRELNNEDTNNTQSSTIRMIKSNKMRLIGHVARKGEWISGTYTQTVE
jgi:hypothetical protein